MRATSLGVKDLDLAGIPQALSALTSFLLPLIQKLRLLRAPAVVSALGKYLSANSDFP